MPLQKRKHSQSRRDKRRTHWKIARPSLRRCSQCGRAGISHRVCPGCGFYRGRAVIAVKKSAPAS
ncbi:MAG: 50S ribosomal protein L32 [Candidatus Omnitrophica bacterium]|nr:50S ribosomal protein L32 [Candidatus Omnitrophota bacterium]